MYKIYLDKNELFEAKITLEGAMLKDTTARLLMQTEQWNLVFEGEIDSGGNVEIPIKRLKSIFSDDVKGNLKLEVVADDTYFIPWSDEFELLRSKSVTVEVKQKEDKLVIKESTPKVEVKQKEEPKPSINEERVGLSDSMNRMFLKKVW